MGRYKKNINSCNGRMNGLKPFFGYYGGKWRNAKLLYPAPKYNTIIEPFAGSAGYSLRYSSRNIILCEIDPILVSVWNYLIKVKPSEILQIRDLRPNETVDDLEVCQEARWLVGFWLNRGTSSPRKSPSLWMREGIRPGSFWGQRVKETIASQVEKIRHWKVYHGSYIEFTSPPNNATWFIDAPYINAGCYYRYGAKEIDYLELAYWCKSRKGQVIVCENDGARWLPFRSLRNVKTTRADSLSKEVIWCQDYPDHFSE